MTSKRINLPKDLERAEIEAPKAIREFEYDRAVEADFNANRQQYREIELHGVKILVKVKPKL